MKIYNKNMMKNSDESVTFLEDYQYEDGGGVKKGERLTTMEIMERDIRFCHKPQLLSWGYNCENKLNFLNKQ